jgi:hypothetical protein
MKRGMPDSRDSVDIDGLARPPESSGGPPASAAKPWLGLHFRCSGAYGRAYRNPAGTAYVGRCPSCGKTVRFTVGEGGTSERMFRVNC